MFYQRALQAVALLASLAQGSPLIDARQQTPCTAQYRLDELNGVAPAFSDMTPGATTKYLQQLPLKPDATLTLYINGLPGITVAPDASLVRDFAFGVRQVFYYVYPTSTPPSTDYGNGTTHTELEIVTGLLHTIALPVNFHAGMNFNWDLSDCTLTSLQGFLTIPSAILGRPVSVDAIVQELLAAGRAGKLPAA